MSDKDYEKNRVYNASPGELVVITYEGMFKAIDAAIEHHKNENFEGFSKEVRKAVDFITDLFDALDFSMQVAQDLGSLYFFCRNHMLLGMTKNDVSYLNDVMKILRPLYEGFCEAVKSLHSTAENSGEIKGVVAGMTYGKGSLNEMVAGDENKGFKA